MTLKEVAQLLGKKESTIYKNFKRTCDNLRKKGIILSRWEIDGEIEYEVEWEEIDDEDEN